MIFELTATGDRQAERRLAQIGDRAERTRPLMEDIVGELLGGERRQWHSQTGWAPLAASTRERKRRQHLPARILRETGALERAMTVRGAPGQLVKIGQHTVTFGIKPGRNPAYKGRFHQKGKGVPRRVVIPAPTQQTRRGIAGAVHRHLTS